jgi:mRNA interferase MazF
VELTESDFAEGTLQRVSFARPGKLFTAHQSLLSARVGILSPEAHTRIVNRVVTLVRSGLTPSITSQPDGGAVEL